MEWLYKEGHKAIIFIQSDKKAYELYQKYEAESTFICGKQSRFQKFVNEEKVKYITHRSTFQTQTLSLLIC